MKKLLFFFVLASTLFLSSCAKHIITTYQESSENTGKVFILPSNSTYWTSITLNNKLVIQNKFVKSVLINNVPAGIYRLDYTYSNCNNCIYPKDILLPVKKDKTVTQLIQVPKEDFTSTMSLALLILFLGIYIQ